MEFAEQELGPSSTICVIIKSEKRVECCIVCHLLEHGTSGFTFEEKLDVVFKGRPEPVLDIQTKSTKCMRHFNTSIYDNCKWLTGCQTVSKLFCWPCLLFNVTEKTIWNTAGYSDLNNLSKTIKKHAASKTHLAAVIEEKLFGRTRTIDDQPKLISHRQHNDLVKKNREILKRVVDITCFLGEHELTFRGHGENVSSVNRANFLDLSKLLSTYDEVLRNNLDQQSRCLSNTIQSDLISAVANVALQTMKDEINEADFVSIIVDETTDVSDLSQVSVVLRYVNGNGKVQKRFWTFLDTSAEKTADHMYIHVRDIVNELDCGTKFVAQSYDGAAVMAGHLGGLQTKVRQTYKNAMPVHCFGQRGLAQSVGMNTDCKVFFQTLSGMGSFFSKSPKRTRALGCTIQKQFPGVEPIRWHHNSRLAKTVSQYKRPLIELFEEILDQKHRWDSETVNSSRGYSELLKSDFDFNFLLETFSEVLPFTDILLLQTNANDIGFCVKQIVEFQIRIGKLIDQFEIIWQRVTELADVEPKPKRMRTDDVGDIETCYRRLFLEILDNILQHHDDILGNLNELKFLELCNFDKYSNIPFPEEAFNSLKKHYGNLFDVVALHSQLSVLYTSQDIAAANSCWKMLRVLKETGLDEAYGEVFKLCRLVLTIPATIPSVNESSFSVFERIETFVRSSVSEERSADLAVLCIEKELINDLRQKPDFYDCVINEFAKQDRGIELHYK